MNPPSGIHGAMSRDRKPFTYTPGGIDLSEIKSERMAKRLMRNAMDEGISEVSVPSIHSPPIASSSVIVPNFNCLPVQVFPTFKLPSNPKSLLRSRSNPDQSRDPPEKKNAHLQYENSNKSSIENNDNFRKTMPVNSQISNNRPASMYEYSSIENNNFLEPMPNYSGAAYKESPLPEISYDVEYYRMLPKTNQITNDKKLNTETVENNYKTINIDTVINMPINPVSDKNINTLLPKMKPVEEETGSITQREVKVKKSIKKEQKTIEERNGDQNGDIEAELTVKLPTKKIGATIETKVEVEKKLLPDDTVEEIKTITTTKTTPDGKKEISTKTESRILSEEETEKEIEEIEEEIEEEEEEEEELNAQEIKDKTEKQHESNVKNPNISSTINVNSQDKSLKKSEEKSETTVTTTKKVVVVQSDNEETEEVEEEVEEEEQVEEEEEEIEEIEPVTTVSIKKPENISTPPPEVTETEIDEDKAEAREDKNSDIKENTLIDEKGQIAEDIKSKDEQSFDDEVKKTDDSVNKEQVIESKIEKEEQPEEEVFEEAEIITMDKETEKRTVIDVEGIDEKVQLHTDQDVSEKIITIEPEKPEEDESKIDDKTVKSEIKDDEKQETQNEKTEQKLQIETKIPLEKIEDIEIKPIGPAGVITKTHTEKTEIITSSSDQPPGVHSTQTEYNRIENIVTVNRTTKTLDNTYENVAQQEIPTVKTYFTPSRILSSPMPASPYQPVYPPVSTERRHSLLLDRLSVERQMPSEIYHSQTYEQQRQTSQEPQSEVLTISNVKPSKITNQQWYQQSKESVYNNVTPTPLSSETPSWAQTKVQPHPTYKPQPTYQPQQSYQTQQSYQPQSTYQPQQTYQTQQSFPPQQTYQPQQNYSQPTPQSQYQPSYIDPVQTNKYSSFTSKPVNRVSSLDTTPSLSTTSNLYSFNNDSSETYQKSTQQYSSSYVPPPWEQDSSYIADSNQNYYQPPVTGTLNPTPTPTQSWKPTLPKGKFSKPPPTAYIPPAPNQSFVKAVSNVEPSTQSSRKTYYSEYERRYISVPESTYIPHETKYQPQPDPSPKYYYDNTESNEAVEHEWRKELREFTEKTSQTPIQTEQTAVKPPWESDPKYGKAADLTYTPTPTWSQTVRPRSWRERSFESEYVGSQEWPKTNTLGRGRPLTSYNKTDPIPERTRGVSVDRYNPNSYKPPTSLEHPPVQTHTLPTPAPHGTTTYHNPNVPAYHSRASDDTREQPASYKQPRVIREQRASPFQSRSFKYLQWITGTED